MSKSSAQHPIFAAKFLGYFGEVKDELKKVTWPGRSQTISLTWLVVGISVVVALYLGLLDAAFQWLVKTIIHI